MVEVVNKLNSFRKMAVDTALWLCGALVVLFVMVIGMVTVAPIIVTDVCVSVARRVLGVPYERNNLNVS